MADSTLSEETTTVKNTMVSPFKPELRPSLIGSLPYKDHAEALAQVIAHTPDIPIWAQLPTNPNEQMIPQFLPGMPGLRIEKDRMFIARNDPSFDAELLSFYEAYLAITEGNGDAAEFGLSLTPDIAGGFFALVDYLKSPSTTPIAVKGQVTGPITFGTGVKDENGRPIFYDEQTRDAANKLLAVKAHWQVHKLAGGAWPVIIFIDEPALAGFGSSELISISREETIASLAEVVTAIHAAGGLAGIHVCANTDWSLVLASGVDIVNFDAYLYFDRFILFPDEIKSFIDGGGVLAWGIVPTGDPAYIEKETSEALSNRWRIYARQMMALGIERNILIDQSMITPSCGIGSLSVEHAEKVLRMTKNLSARLRSEPI